MSHHGATLTQYIPFFEMGLLVGMYAWYDMYDDT